MSERRLARNLGFSIFSKMSLLMMNKTDSVISESLTIIICRSPEHIILNGLTQFQGEGRTCSSGSLQEDLDWTLMLFLMTVITVVPRDQPSMQCHWARGCTNTVAHSPCPIEQSVSIEKPAPGSIIEISSRIQTIARAPAQKLSAPPDPLARGMQSASAHWVSRGNGGRYKTAEGIHICRASWQTQPALHRSPSQPGNNSSGWKTSQPLRRQLGK